jgi:hypothetical protein
MQWPHTTRKMAKPFMQSRVSFLSLLTGWGVLTADWMGTKSSYSKAAKSVNAGKGQLFNRNNDGEAAEMALLKLYWSAGKQSCGIGINGPSMIDNKRTDFRILIPHRNTTFWERQI